MALKHLGSLRVQKEGEIKLCITLLSLKVFSFSKFTYVPIFMFEQEVAIFMSEQEVVQSESWERGRAKENNVV